MLSKLITQLDPSIKYSNNRTQQHILLLRSGSHYKTFFSRDQIIVTYIHENNILRNQIAKIEKKLDRSWVPNL